MQRKTFVVFCYLFTFLFFQSGRTAEILEIAIVGDSLTGGNYSTDDIAEHRGQGYQKWIEDKKVVFYPEILSQQFTKEKLPFQVVAVDARAGSMASTALDRVKLVLNKNPNIDLVVLELGINDVLNNFSPREAANHLQTAIDYVTEREKSVFVLGVQAPAYRIGEQFDIVRDNNAGCELYFQLDNMLEGLTRKHFRRIPTSVPHPITTGHKKIAKTIRNFLIAHQGAFRKDP